MDMPTISDIKAVYNKLSDEQSKRMFLARLRYFFTEDKTDLHELLNINDEHDNGYNSIEELLCSDVLHEHEFIIYGAGAHSIECLRRIKSVDYSVFAFCDRDEKKQLNGHLGLPVIPPETLSAHLDKDIVIGTAGFRDEMYEYVKSAGFTDERIFVLGKFEESYFGSEFMYPVDDEIFIDAGAFDGYTVERFLRFCDGKYKKIYAFEPMPEQFCYIQNRFPNNDKIKLFNKAVWDCETALMFTEDGEGSKITGLGELTVKTVAIDDVVLDEAVTFIKMDVEGAELEALHGAEQTIRKNKPRLAICVYHKPEDILTIPLYIQSIVPEYRFYLRHHDFDYRFCETVLYALPPNV